MTIPTTEPTSVNAGDTLAWQKTFSDYPASAGWVLGYTFINATNKITIAGTASGDDHAIAVPAAASAGWVAGAYSWQSRITKGAEAYTLEQGSIVIVASFASQALFDNRSHAQYTLLAIEAVIEGRASSATLEYEIAGRKMKYFSHGELYSLRTKYKAEVARELSAERISKGLSDPRRVFVRFGP